jgi:hypothetical protein
MNKIYLLLIFSLISIGSAKAQTEVKDGYVTSEKGFVYKSGKFTIGKKKFKYAGLYSADGKVCVKTFKPIGSSNQEETVVAPGTEIVVNGACYWHYYVWLPTTVKKIGEDALMKNQYGLGETYFYNAEDIVDHIVNQQ